MTAWIASMTGNLMSHVSSGPRRYLPFMVVFKTIVGFAAVFIVLVGAYGNESFAWQFGFGCLGAIVGGALVAFASGHASSHR